ncbi:hypothetical protein [Streptomyces sp. NRRL F-5065]|uniref:hypothetical protein n=1 Tax=Streptomyces sp. NRRL F-5065 TaxID=1463855 RepID=UPI0004BEA89E|nr:hypothetical protein [Streptomyces sp. NRRL F-5065]
MAFDMSKFGGGRWVKTHPNNVHTHGSTEPIMTVLELRGFELRDLFLIGFNDSCGSIVLPSESRAENAAAALEPAYETRVHLMGSRDGEDVWATDYTRRALDGTTLSAFITNLTLTDGRQVIKDGRWVR